MRQALKNSDNPFINIRSRQPEGSTAFGMERSTELAHPAHSGLHDNRVMAAMLGLLAASGSIVFIEPAPYDMLAMAMFPILLVTGLRFPRDLQLPVFLLGVFLAGNILSAMLAPDPLQSIRSLSIRIYMVLTWLMIASLIARQPGKMLHALWTGYMVAALIAVAWGTAEYLGLIHNELWQGGLRARGAFKDPNVYGPFLVPAAIHSVRKLTRSRPADIALYLPLFLLVSFGILLSFSRGAWINFALSLSLYVSFEFLSAPGLRVRINWLLVTMLAIAMMVAVLAAAVSVDVIGDRFFQRAVIAQKYDVQSGGRFDTQRKAIEEIAVDPIGVGPGRSDEAFGLEPHDLYLHVFVEGGWLAGFSWLVFLFLTGYRLVALIRYRHPLRQEAFLLTACLTGLIAQSFFIDSTHWRHFWLLLAVSWGVVISCRRSQSAMPEPPLMSKLPSRGQGSRYPSKTLVTPQ